VSEVTQSAAAFWLARERVEVEAAALFLDLSERLRRLAAPKNITDLCVEAHRDELRHADQCRAIIDALRGSRPVPPVERRRVAWRLSPAEADLDPQAEALYAAVAIGCVTESLSTALLAEIRGRAEHPLVQDTAHAILRDEVNHSRIGWAYLANAAKNGDVRWLGAHVDAMLRAALDEEASPVPGASEDLEAGALEPFGVLSARTVRLTCEATVREVIVPGLAHFGIPCAASTPAPAT